MTLRVSYEVTATVGPGLADAFERFMVDDHIPELLATGCFRAAALIRLAPGRYRMRYEADGRTELERYLELYAPRVRGGFVARFPGGVALEREVGELLGTWGGGC